MLKLQMLFFFPEIKAPEGYKIVHHGESEFSDNRITKLNPLVEKPDDSWKLTDGSYRPIYRTVENITYIVFSDEIFSCAKRVIIFAKSLWFGSKT
ncbi:hypothetical protein HMPREF3204_01074 [Gardnerella pickettii]|nr:hypothetical protein HMPREF3204_01074 [Gardnerella pickettii]